MYIAFLLVFTASYVPVRVSFFDEVSNFMNFIEGCIDASFLLDIVLTFFSAYERKDGQIETRKGKIAITYIKTWFLLDLISSMPYQAFEAYLEPPVYEQEQAE